MKRTRGAGPPDELGAHVSIAGGLERAVERARALDCGAMQIFLKNQRRWAAPPLAPAEAARFVAARRAAGIRWAFAHASYLINLAAPDAAEWTRAVDTLTDELQRAEALELDFVVIHPGSHRGAGVEAGLARVVAALDEALRRTQGFRVRVALENTAGAGHAVGRTLEELGALVGRAARPERLGVCLDTCHLFAAGYDIRTPAGWAAALAACARAVGLERVLAFHLNDARAPLGSGLDRHAHIGRGALGLVPFRLLLTDQRLREVPKVLETPKDPEPAADRRNLRVLRRLRFSATSSPRRAGRGRARGSASTRARAAYTRAARS